MPSQPVTLQINIAPVDYPMVLHTLPEQLAVLGKHCQEVLLTFDTKRVEGSRLSEEDWNNNLALIDEFIEQDIKKAFPGISVKVDKMLYDDSLRKEIGTYFFGKPKAVPLKDFRGGPYYSYYFGLYRAANDYIIHLDADMMLVGNAELWFDEAIEALKADDSLFACAPLLGAPAKTDELSDMQLVHPKRYNPIKKYTKPYSFLYNDFSTRIFFFDRTKLKGKSRVERPNLDHHVKALLRGNPPYRFPEGTISSLLKREHWWVLSFKGQGEGLWALHPLLSAEFKQKLPYVIEAIKKGDYPDSQRGYPDVQQELLDQIKLPEVGNQ